jgi:hypothetical protein
MMNLMPLLVLAQGAPSPEEIGALVLAVADGHATLGWLGALSALVYGAVKLLRFFAPALWGAMKPGARAALVFCVTFLGALLATAGAALVAGSALGAAFLSALVPALVAAIPAGLGAMGVRAVEKAVVAPRLGVTDKQSIKVPIVLPKP